MKRIIVLLMVGLVSVAAQAGPLGLVDDFEDGNMDEYVQTVVLETETTDYDTVFTATGGVLQAELSVFGGIEQALCLRDDYTLDIGEILKVDTTGWVNGGNQDLGIAVAATKSPALGGPREDYLFILLRTNRDHYLTRQFAGTSEEPYVQGWPGDMDALYIERIDADTFETGYYIGATKTSVHSMDVANTAVGNAIGFYSDMRAVNTIGVFDNLEIIPEPATMALLGIGSVFALRRRRR